MFFSLSLNIIFHSFLICMVHGEKSVIIFLSYSTVSKETFFSGLLQTVFSSLYFLHLEYVVCPDEVVCGYLFVFGWSSLCSLHFLDLWLGVHHTVGETLNQKFLLLPYLFSFWYLHYTWGSAFCSCPTVIECFIQFFTSSLFFSILEVSIDIFSRSEILSQLESIKDTLLQYVCMYVFIASLFILSLDFHLLVYIAPSSCMLYYPLERLA